MATAPTVTVPHFALPLRYRNGSALVNQQDSIEDITDCVYAVGVTSPGDRTDLPDFGLLDMAFDQEPLPISVAQTQIEQWEPRAQILIDAAPDQYDLALVNAQVNVEQQTS